MASKNDFPIQKNSIKTSYQFRYIISPNYDYVYVQNFMFYDEELKCVKKIPRNDAIDLKNMKQMYQTAMSCSENHKKISQVLELMNSLFQSIGNIKSKKVVLSSVEEMTDIENFCKLDVKRKIKEVFVQEDYEYEYDLEYEYDIVYKNEKFRDYFRTQQVLMGYRERMKEYIELDPEGIISNMEKASSQFEVQNYPEGVILEILEYKFNLIKLKLLVTGILGDFSNLFSINVTKINELTFGELYSKLNDYVKEATSKGKGKVTGLLKEKTPDTNQDPDTDSNNHLGIGGSQSKKDSTSNNNDSKFREFVAKFDCSITSKSSSYGTVDLDNSFPEKVSQFFVDHLPLLVSHTDMTGSDVMNMQNGLISLTFFKAAKQLHSSMTPREKSFVKSLQLHESTLIPKTISCALSIIGHIDSPFGYINVKYPAYLYRYWIWKGLNLTESSSITPIWYDKDSYLWLRYIIDRHYHGMTKIPFNGRIGDYELEGLTLPQIQRDSRRRDFNSIISLHPKSELLSDLLDIYFLDYRAYHPMDIPENVKKELNIKCIMNSDKDLQDDFENFITSWGKENYSDILESIFECDFGPLTESGSFAQLMGKNDSKNSSISHLPMDDYDAMIGWMFLPCKRFFSFGRFITSSRYERKKLITEISKTDIKSRT